MPAAAGLATCLPHRRSLCHLQLLLPSTYRTRQKAVAVETDQKEDGQQGRTRKQATATCPRNDMHLRWRHNRAHRTHTHLHSPTCGMRAAFARSCGSILRTTHLRRLRILHFRGLLRCGRTHTHAYDTHNAYTRAGATASPSCPPTTPPPHVACPGRGTGRWFATDRFGRFPPASFYTYRFGVPLFHLYTLYSSPAGRYAACGCHHLYLHTTTPVTARCASAASAVVGMAAAAKKACASAPAMPASLSAAEPHYLPLPAIPAAVILTLYDGEMAEIITSYLPTHHTAIPCKPTCPSLLMPE